MISYVVPLWREKHFEKWTRPEIQHQIDTYGGELILESDPYSIFAALERGRQKAKFPLVCYMHDDLQILDLDASERMHRLMGDSGAGLMGVVGSHVDERCIPWWTANRCVGGWTWLSREKKPFYQDARITNAEPLNHQRHPTDYELAWLLDGIFMVENRDVTGDLPWMDADGWHGYDIDRSMQVHNMGADVIVGDVSVCHHSPSKPYDLAVAWSEALNPRLDEMRERWGMA